MADLMVHGGPLPIGKWADFVVLSGNPSTALTETIGSGTVDQTFLRGRLAFER